MFKNFILVCWLCLLAPAAVYGCDACGCGVGGGGFGLLGIYRTNFVGWQYGYAGFRSLYSSGEPTGTEDAFHNISLAARFSIHPRLRVDIRQGYVVNHRDGPLAGVQELSGFNDLNLGLSYVLLQSKPNGSKLSTYLEVGMAAALPLGRYEPRPLNDFFLPDNFSPGRGALAASPHFLLAVNGRRLGAALQGEGRWYGKTETDYRFGSEQRLSLNVFSEFSLAKLSRWVPFVGMQYEHTNVNKSRSGNGVYGTGGSAILARAGLQFRFTRFTAGVSASSPIRNEYANGEVAAKERLAAEVYYLF